VKKSFMIVWRICRFPSILDCCLPGCLNRGNAAIDNTLSNFPMKLDIGRWTAYRSGR
jgi:hypothetical protein